MSRSRGWCFTDNNPSSDVLPAWGTIYRIYQKEQGASGTPHLQGYAYWSQPKTLKACKDLLPTAHWEVAKGSPQQNKDYCSKSVTRVSDPVEEGELPRQGKRNDIQEACDLIKEGKRLKDLDGAVVVKYAKGLQLYRQLFQAPRNTPPTVHWFYGSTGTGKSRRAAELGGDDIYWKPPGKWWDLYSNEKTVVLDDLRSEDYSFQFLLRLLDRYPLKVEFKGGFCEFTSSVIIITAPCRPEELYTFYDQRDHIAQLHRRITHIVEFK